MNYTVSDPATGEVLSPPGYRMTEAENVVGVDPLDQLHAYLDAMQGDFSTLQAKRDVWDARRKERRSSIAALILNELKAQGIKEPSEAAMERIASGDPRYTKVLDDAEADFARLAWLDIEIQQVRDRIARGNALTRFGAATA